MNLVIKVPDQLANKYCGSGYALVAISDDNKTLIDFAYLRDIDPDFDEEVSPQEAALVIVENERFKAHGHFFEQPGYSRMAFGMLSSWEFVEL